MGYAGLWKGIVAARMPRMTTAQSLNAQPRTFHYTVFINSLAGILRTAWDKTTRNRFKRTNQILVAVYHLDQDSAHCAFNWLNSFTSPSRWARLLAGIVCRTITTKSTGALLISCRRKVSFITRFALLRSTALNNFFLLTMIPSLALTAGFRTKKILKFWSEMLSD